MWDNFFTYRSDLPESVVGWSHFGQAHLTYLAIFATATIIMALIYKRGDERRKKRIKIAYAAIVVTLEVIKDIICIVIGVWKPELLPLHLCGMTIVFIVVHAIRANRWTGVLLYCLSLPGAAMALTFGDWTVYPLLNFFCQQSFIIHFFLFSFSVMLLASGELRPRFSELWRAVVFLAIVVPPIYFFNIYFGTNFFFLNTAAPGSPLMPLEALGMPGYFFGYAALVFVFWLIMYTPWMLKNAVEKRRGVGESGDVGNFGGGGMLVNSSDAGDFAQGSTGTRGDALGESNRVAQ